jgi:hypothetical protein
MTELTQGTVTVVVEDETTLPEAAGKLTRKEVLSLPKPKRGVGKACDQTAQALQDAGDRVFVPGITPDGLRQAGERAEALESIVANLEALLVIIRQALLLNGAEAQRQLMKVAAFVQAHKKTDPRLMDLFVALREYFPATTRKKKGAQASTTAPAPSSSPTPYPL